MANFTVIRHQQLVLHIGETRAWNGLVYDSDHYIIQGASIGEVDYDVLYIVSDDWSESAWVDVFDPSGIFICKEFWD